MLTDSRWDYDCDMSLEEAKVFAVHLLEVVYSDAIQKSVSGITVKFNKMVKLEEKGEMKQDGNTSIDIV